MSFTTNPHTPLNRKDVLTLVHDGSRADLKEWRFIGDREGGISKLTTAFLECETAFVIKLNDTVLGIAGVRKHGEDEGGVLWSFFKKLTVSEVKALIDNFPQVLDEAFKSGHETLYNEIHEENRLFQELILKHGGEIHSYKPSYKFFIIHKDEVVV